MGYRNQRDINNTATSGAWTVTNIVESTTLDCNQGTLSGAAGVTNKLATLILQLKEMGIINGSVS